jgi:elongation factor G
MTATVENKRIVTLVGIDGNGKTTTVKRLLNFKGELQAEPEEQSRGYTLFSKTFVTDLPDNKELYLLDTPGSLNYINDVINCSRVSNGALCVINANNGVSEHGVRLWWRIGDYNLPAILYVNMMDSDSADFDKALDSIKTLLNVSPLPITIPVGKGTEFVGVINLIKQKMYTYKDDSGKPKEEDIPAQYSELVEKYRAQMIEAVVENDEALMAQYLEGKEISVDELRKVLGKSVKLRGAFPVFAGSSEKNIGLDQVREAIFHYLPSGSEFNQLKFKEGDTPQAIDSAPLSAFVFKTRVDAYTGKLNYVKIVSGKLSKNSKALITDNNHSLKLSKINKPYADGLKPVEEAVAGDIVVLDKCEDLKTGFSIMDSSISGKIFEPSPEPKRVLSYAVDVADKKLEEKIGASLRKISEEDPSISFNRIPETKELVLSGLGQLQLDVVNEMLKERYKLDVTMRAPRIQYRETIKKTVEAQGKHKKQSGGHGQYGDAYLRLEPLPKGKGFEFVDAIVGGVIPRNFIPSVEKGIIKTMERGTVAGFPVIDVRATLYFGSYHDVDSSDMAFQIAGSMAFKKCMEEANPILLEPIMDVTIYVPDNYVGTITNDLSGRRGRISGMDTSPEGSIVKGLVPLAEMATYAPELHSMTKGLGLFEMKFHTYEEVPAQNANKIIEETKKWRQEEEENKA